MKVENLLKDNKICSLFKIIEIVEGKGNDKLKFDECWYKGYY